MKTVFVLSGGGVKGSFQVGVLHQLLSKGIVPDAIYGTSAGAINACSIAYLGADKAVDYWLSIKGRGDALYPTGIAWLWNFWRLLGVWNDGIYSTKPLRKIITSVVKSNPNPTLEAISCFVDLTNGKVGYTSNKSSPDAYIDSVISSATIPMIMETNQLRVDGGVREQTPVTKAIADGATEIYVILCNPYVPDPLGVWSHNALFFKWFDTLNRAVDDVMCHEIFLTDLEECLENKDVKFHVYAPDRLWMGTIEFDPTKIKAAIAAGKTAVPIIL